MYIYIHMTKIYRIIMIYMVLFVFEYVYIAPPYYCSGIFRCRFFFRNSPKLPLDIWLWLKQILSLLKPPTTHVFLIYCIETEKHEWFCICIMLFSNNQWLSKNDQLLITGGTWHWKLPD